MVEKNQAEIQSGSEQEQLEQEIQRNQVQLDQTKRQN